MKVLTVLGARPQFIKASSISREISNYESINEVIIHTGQHYDKYMSDVFFEEMKIPKPKYFLEVKEKMHGSMTGQMMCKIESIVLKENPDWILVYGDTNSTLAGAIVASKLNIKLAHIEAGLRSFNMQMPEEVNRILTDRVSNILFCPTSHAMDNLKAEGFDNFNCKIVNSGDVMHDGVIFYKDFAIKPSCKIEKTYILVTVHRAENTDNDENLKSLFSAFKYIAKDKQIILPLHPRTRNVIKSLNIDTSKLTIIEPVGYFEMLWLIDNCSLVMTDSGGLQKEAYFCKKFCITLRNETEWMELVDGGFNTLVGSNMEKIINAYENKNVFNINNSNLYGSGNASGNIIKELINYE